MRQGRRWVTMRSMVLLLGVVSVAGYSCGGDETGEPPEGTRGGGATSGGDGGGSGGTGGSGGVAGGDNGGGGGSGGSRRQRRGRRAAITAEAAVAAVPAAAAVTGGARAASMRPGPIARADPSAPLGDGRRGPRYLQQPLGGDRDSMWQLPQGPSRARRFLLHGHPGEPVQCARQERQDARWTSCSAGRCPTRLAGKRRSAGGCRRGSSRGAPPARTSSRRVTWRSIRTEIS